MCNEAGRAAAGVPPPRRLEQDPVIETQESHKQLKPRNHISTRCIWCLCADSAHKHPCIELLVDLATSFVCCTGHVSLQGKAASTALIPLNEGVCLIQSVSMYLKTPVATPVHSAASEHLSSRADFSALCRIQTLFSCVKSA